MVEDQLNIMAETRITQIVYVVCFLCLLSDIITGSTLTAEQNLQTTLLTGYKSNLRPGMNRSIPLDVNISFHIFSIKEFQESTGKFSVNGAFVLEWNDERLAWDPNSYDNLTMTNFPQNQIWIPNLVNINPFGDISGLGSDLISLEVYSTGYCKWVPYQSLSVICDADVTKYPFDTQYCTMNFFMWSYKKNSVKITVTSPTVGFSLYTKHGLWDIVNSLTYTNPTVHGYDEVIVALWLERRTAFYISSLIIPMFSISMLMGLVFLLPPESGERVGFITTVLLSYIVFLTIIQDKLPESSEPGLSIIGYILMICVIWGTLTTALVIISLCIHNAPNDQSLPGFIRKCLSCKRRKATVENIKVVKPCDTKTESLVDEEEDVTWADVGKAFDRICMILCILQGILTVIIYFGLVL